MHINDYDSAPNDINKVGSNLYSKNSLASASKCTLPNAFFVIIFSAANTLNSVN